MLHPDYEPAIALLTNNVTVHFEGVEGADAYLATTLHGVMSDAKGFVSVAKEPSGTVVGVTAVTPLRVPTDVAEVWERDRERTYQACGTWQAFHRILTLCSLQLTPLTPAH